MKLMRSVSPLFMTLVVDFVGLAHLDRQRKAKQCVSALHVGTTA
jgi:hypothetical protein